MRFSPWNSTGATTSTAITGSKMTGLALLKASLKAPKAASLKANSDESWTWAAPSSKMNRQPLIECPVRKPRSKASLNPYDKNTRGDVSITTGSRISTPELTFSMAGMYWLGIFPPMILFSKAVSLPVSASGSMGSIEPLTFPN